MLFIIGLFVFCSRTGVSEEVLCQPDRLGIQHGSIENSQITASSFRSKNGRSYDPWRARLNNPTEKRYWRPDMDATSGSWLQVDFLDTVVISGIETQGSGDDSKTQRWVSQFQVQIGNETSMSYFMEGGSPKSFSANSDINSIERITFPQRVSTRYLRILPTKCKSKCGFRFEVLGCQLVDDCARTAECDINAEYLDQNDGFQCTCHQGYSGNGFQCEDTNECASSPCLNYGMCTEDGVNSYHCTCAEGFNGDTCDIDIDECASFPCLNNSTCEDVVNSYRCNCSEGFTGETCQTDIDECTSNPCLNEGTCMDGINSFSCSCAVGFTGTRCQTDINECASNPCLNEGTCTDGINSFSCSCAVGFTHIRCQTATIQSDQTETQTPSRAPSSAPTHMTMMTVEYKPPDSKYESNRTITGVFAGVIFLATLAVLVAYMIYRYKKQSANPRLELHGPYFINTDDYEEETLQNKDIFTSKKPDSPPNSNEANGNVHQSAEKQNTSYLYERIDDSQFNDARESSALPVDARAPSAPPMFLVVEDEGLIDQSSSGNSKSETIPPVYAKVDKGMKNDDNRGPDQHSGEDIDMNTHNNGVKDENEEVWVENTKYVSFDGQDSIRTTTWTETLI